MDYDKEHGQVKEHLIGEAELNVSTFLVPGEKQVEVFHKDKHGHPKKAGYILLSSELIPENNANQEQLKVKLEKS